MTTATANAGPAYTVRGATGDWEVVVGLEVHAQVTSNAKLFSGAPATYGGEPNSQVSPVDAGMPGMLPVVNAYCVEQAVRTGLGLRARINRLSVFERKNYFYPGPAERLPDQPVPAPDRRRGCPHDRPAGRRLEAGRHHPAASRDGRRQVGPRRAGRRDPDRPQPLRRGADGDRLRAGHPQPGRGRGLHAQAALDRPLPRHLRRQHGGGLAALRRQRLRPSRRRYDLRHPLRDQERQLHPLRRARHRVRGPTPGRAAGRGRPRRAGDAPVRRREG